MTRPLHQRILTFTYFDGDLPTFSTPQEQDEWYRMLGRLLAYGLTLKDESNEDLVQFVSLMTHSTDEVGAVYYPKLTALPETWPDGSPKYTGSPAHVIRDFVQEFLDASMKQGRPFVMGAVKGDDGKFGFHS